MASNVVAYVGYESFDVILYQSRILQALGRKVLLVDYSETRALTSSIPQVKGLDTVTNIMTYRRVDLTSLEITEKIIKDYDDILINCGFEKPNIDISIITKTIYVTDMFRYNLEKLKMIKYYDDQASTKELLIREATDFKITPEVMIVNLEKDIPRDNISIIYRDDRDYDNCLLCHYNQEFRFKRISSILKTYLIQKTCTLCSNLSIKAIRKAYKSARKGE